MIRVESVSKRYAKQPALDDVSFVAQAGRVTGFLGPNGAGKSTTMRIMTGLTPADAGSITIGGMPYAALKNPGRHVGVLLDASAQHAGRTGREALRIGAITMDLPAGREDELLDLVSLTPAEAKRRIGTYSLGMRQRLGIAHALLGDPSVLILDEPANGLDPAGIHWMRGLLRGHAERGGTVLLSSHLLHEVEVIADDLVVIGNGRIVARGTKAELLQTAGTVVRAEDSRPLLAALGAAGLIVRPLDDDRYRVDAAPVQVGRAVAGTAVVLLELRPADEAGLEQLFLDLTATTQRDAAPGAAPALEGVTR